MSKTVLMMLGLAAVFIVGTACFRLLGPPSEPEKGTAIEACAGLAGEAKADCERRGGR